MSLHPDGITKRASASPQEIEFIAPVKPVPLGQQRFAAMQLGLPLLPPVRAQTSRDDHADQSDQP